MFLINIADHAGPILSTLILRLKKSKNKPKHTHKTDIPVTARFFFKSAFICVLYRLNFVIFVPSSCSALSSRRGARRVDSMLHLTCTSYCVTCAM